MVQVYFVQIIMKKICNTINKNLKEIQTGFIVNKLSLSIEKNDIIFMHIIFQRAHHNKKE